MLLLHHLADHVLQAVKADDVAVIVFFAGDYVSLFIKECDDMRFFYAAVFRLNVKNLSFVRDIMIVAWKHFVLFLLRRND